MTVTLRHDQYVRLASWTNSYAQVGTVEGIYRKTPGCEVYGALARAKALGHDIAFATYAGSTITSSKGFYEREAERVASAAILAEGQRVEIEGRAYTVKITPGNAGRFPKNADPIRFVPVA